MEVDVVPVRLHWLDAITDTAARHATLREEAHARAVHVSPALVEMVPQFWILGSVALVRPELENEGDNPTEFIGVDPTEFNGNSVYNMRNEELLAFTRVRQCPSPSCQGTAMLSPSVSRQD